MSRSDTKDIAYMRTSVDNGKSWGAPTVWPCSFEDEGGTGRRHHRGGYLDPNNGRFVTWWTEGVLPNDKPLEGMKQWYLYYAVMEEDGITERFRKQIIHEGTEYDGVHHMPGITRGRNCMMMGDYGELAITRSDGAILLPVQSSPVGSDGSYENPGKGYTYTDCLVLIGRWQEDGHIAWTCSERVCGDPERTTRGLIEPTLAELDDGRILMVMRGSNDTGGKWPGYRWASWSEDGGVTWSKAVPWTYDDGGNFFSPSSTSQLIPHSSGRLFWMGNICEKNPRGHGPRYPIALGEVDRSTGLLTRKSVGAVDDRQPDESPHLTLSNFLVREDRETGDLLLHLPRLFAQDFRENGKANWTTDASLLRITLKAAKD
jgi:hypothetical protein